MSTALTLPSDVRGDLPVVTFPHLATVGVDAFVTTRAGGVSAGDYGSLNLGDHVGDDLAHVTENRRRLTDVVGPLRFVRQVHGATVVTVGDVRGDTEADAVLTATSSPVAILVADCAPLVVVAPAERRLVVVHAGWRGLAAGVIDAAVYALEVEPASLLVGVGPAISQAGYQVGPEVVGAHASFASRASADGGDRFRLDCRGIATDQLEALGVLPSNVVVAAQVTDGGHTFFSDRAARPCGRVALVARWRS